MDTADLDEGRVQAGAANLPSGNPYLPGDANLDGYVDVSDFNVWNSHRLSQTPAWCSGDFNADGFVDASDWNVWNSHRLMSSGDTVVVPEPASLWLSFVALGWLIAASVHFGKLDGPTKPYVLRWHCKTHPSAGRR